jgi:hypothetical protein
MCRRKLSGKPLTDTKITSVDIVPEVARRNMRGYATTGALAVQWIATLSPERIQEVTDYALARWAADGKLRDIADELGTSCSALNRALLKHRLEDWREIQVARAVTLLETAKDELESAAPDEVPRARERLKSAQWDLERLSRRLFGAANTAPSTSGVTINLHIGGATRAPIDSQALRVESGHPPTAGIPTLGAKDSFFDPPDAKNEGEGWIVDAGGSSPLTRRAL